MTRALSAAWNRPGPRRVLFACTAAGALATASGAGAGPTGAQAAAGVTHAPTITTSGGDTRVQLNQDRTIIDWKSLDVGKGEKLDFVFSDKTGIVLNRTTGPATINGQLNGCVVTCSVIGGNVWIYAPSGVIFGSGARVNVGSLLATTTPLTSDSAFLNGATDFTFNGGQAGGKVQVQAGAQLAAHAGALALIAPEVETQAGSSVSAKGTTLLAAAQNYRIRFDESAGGGFDLLDFQVPVSALQDGSVSATPLAVNGAVTGGSVVLAAVSRPSVVNAVVSVGGTAIATGATAGEGGSIVLTGSGSPGSAVDVSGVLQAAGGKIDVTAPAVSLEGRIDVSAPRGGGVVRLGGGARGQDATIADADMLTFAPGATIIADATSKGDGGSVTLWSSIATDFRGAITARGGPGGGAGGNAEVSGGRLNFAGTVDLRGPLGETGTLLLDPGAVEIVHTATTTGDLSTGSYTGASGPPPTDTQFTVDQIDAQLATSNVQIIAGTISFLDAGAYAFDYASAASAKNGNLVAFTADTSFVFGAATTKISAGSGIGLTFQATGDQFTLPATLTIATTAAGDIPATSAGNVTISGVGTTLLAGIDLEGTVDAGSSGAVTLSATGGAITQGVNGSVAAGTLSAQAAGGAVTLNSSNAVGTLALLDGEGASFTNGPDLTVTSATGRSGALTITSGGALTLSSGALGAASNVSLQGTGVEVMGALTLPSATLVTGTTGSVTFDGAVDGAFRLTTSTPTGSTVFRGAVGATTPLASLRAGAVTAGGPITTSGLLQTGALTLTASTALTSTGDNVSIAGASAGSGASGSNLVVSATSGTFASSAALTGLSGLGVRAQDASFASGNDVGTLAANLTVPAGAFSFSNGTNRLTVGAVGGATGLTVGNAKGISLTAGAITVDAAVTTAGGPIALSGASLALGADVNAKTSAATAGDVMLSASNGDITQTAGAITAGTLSAADTANSGAVTLNGANAVGTLTASQAGGGFAFTDASALTTTGTIQGATLALTAPSLTLGTSALKGATSVSLAATTGTVDQAAGGVITTGALKASGFTGVSLLGTGNAITTIARLAVTRAAADAAQTPAGDAITLVNGRSLSLVGAVDTNAGDITITAPGLTVRGGDVNAGSYTASMSTYGGHVTLATTSNGAIDIERPVAAGVSILLDSGSGAITENATPMNTQGVLTAPSLSLRGGAVTLGGANMVGTLASASTGALSLTNAQPLTVQTDSLSLGGALSVTTAGDLTFSSVAMTPAKLTSSYDVALVANGGALTTTGETLSGTDTTYSIKAASFNTAALSPTFNGSGQNFTVEQTAGALDLSAIGTTTVGGTLSLTADAGAVTATPANTLNVGAFKATGTSVSAGNVTASASGGIALTSTSGAVTVNGPLTADAGDATLIARGGGVAVNGLLTVSASDHMAVLSATGGDITQTAAISAPKLDAMSNGALTLTNAANVVTTLTRLAGGTSATFTDAAPGGLTVLAASAGTGALNLRNSGQAGALTLAGPLSAATQIALTSDTGAVGEQTGASASAATLTVRANSGVTLSAGSYAFGSADLLNMGAGAVSFTNGGMRDLNLVQAVTGGGNVTVASGGALHLMGAVKTGAGGSNTATLIAGGLLDQTGVGTITADRLSAQAGGGVDLSPAPNVVGALTLLKDTTPADTHGVKFNDTLSSPLAVVNVDGASGDVVLANTGGLALNVALTAAGHEATLTASNGAITGVGAITAGGLKLSATSVALTGANNNVARIDSLTASAGATFRDAAAGLTVAATNSGSGALDIGNTGGGITLTGASPAIVSGGAATLTAGGAIGQDAGAVLRAPSLSVAGASVTLTEANTAPVLTLLNASGGGSFTTTGGLQVLSAQTGGSALTLTAGAGLSISGGTGISGGLVTLKASGAVSQDAAGKVSAATLTGSAGSDFDLSLAANSVARLQAVSVGGVLALQDTQALTLAGAVGGATAKLLDPSATITQEAGSTLTAGTLTTTTAGGLMLTGANSIGTAQSLVNTGGVGITLNNASSSPLTVAKADAGGGDLKLTTGGDLRMTGPLTAGSATGTQTAMLTAGGAVSQAQGATLVVGVLTGAVGDLRLDQPGNGVGRISDLRSGAGVLLTDTAGLEISGALNAGGAVTLSAPLLTLDAGASLTAASATLTTTAGGVSLLGGYSVSGASTIVSAGTVTQGPGPVTSGVFGATAVGGIVLPVLQTPQISSLVNTGSGDITVTLATPLTTSGLISNAAGAVTLVNTGALAFTDAVDAGSTLVLTAPGGLSGVSAAAGGPATLTAAGVAFTGLVSAGGDLLVQAGAGPASFGALSGGNDITITAGPISVAGPVNVGRDYVLTGTDFNAGALAATFGAGGRDFLLTDTAGGLAFTSLHAPRTLMVTATDPVTGYGAISGGALTAGTGQVLVTGASISLSGPLMARGGGTVLAAKAGGVTLGDAVDVGAQSAVLTATGAVAQTGANGVTAGVLQVNAGAGIALGAANSVSQATLTNTGGGGILFNDLAAAVTIAAAVTGGGDIVLTAPNGALTVVGDLDAPGALRVVAGGDLSGSLFAARAGDLAIQAGGDVTGRALIASGAASLMARSTVFDTASVGGDLKATLSGSLGVRQTDVGGSAQVSAVSASLDTLSVGRDLTLVTDDAFGSATTTVGGSATLRNGSATLTTLTVAGDLGATVSGPFSVVTLSTGGSAQAAASQISFGDLSVGRDLGLATPGSLTVSSARVGGGANLDVGSAAIGSLAVAGDLGARVGGALSGRTLAVRGSAQVSAVSASLDTLSVGRDLTLSAPGAIRLGELVGHSAGALSISGGEVLIGAPSGSGVAAANVLDVDPAGTVRIVSAGDVRVAVSGPARLASVVAGGGLDVLAVNGDAGVADATANGALSVVSQGGSASLGRVSLTGAGPATVTATQDVLLGGGSGVAGADMTLSAPAGLLTVTAGRDVLAAYAGDVALGGAQAGRTLALTAGGLLSAPVLSAGGDARLTGATVRVAAATAGGSLAAHALGGDLALDTASAGGDLSLVADTGAASLRDATLTGAVAGPRTLTITATGNAVLGRASATGAAGRLALADPGRTAVSVRSTGASGGVARVDVQGDARLAQVASASGDVLVAATGVVTGAPTGSDLFTAAKALTVTSGGDATLGGASTAGGAASVDAGGVLTLASLVGDTVRLRATDLTLTGALQGRAACSGACAAPTVAIESRSGPLTLGAAPAVAGFAPGGMTIDSAELGRVKGTDVALYAGSTVDAARRGDLQVGDLSLNGGDIGVLRLLAGPANTVRVAGVVTPTAANTGALVIGGAQAAGGWTPRSIYVTGALGQGSANATSTAVGFGSVELNAVRDVLIGSPTFVAAVTAAEPAGGGSAVGAINITRGLPAGVQATAAELNREIVTTGALTLRADGYVVSQNTGAIGEQGGLFLSNPSRAATVLTLGRTGAVGGSLTPSLIDLSLSFVNGGGTVISRQIAASSPAVDLGDLSRSDAYRINGCSIGAATSCTPLPNTIVDIRINKLVEGVQLATDDPPPVDDPTITGAGNEEIWRSPAACSPDSGEPCR